MNQKHLPVTLTHFHFSLGKRAVQACSSDPASKPGQLGGPSIHKLIAYDKFN